MLVLLNAILSHSFRERQGNALAHVMSETSALPPPSGLSSNFNNPVSQRQTLIVINSVVPCVMLVFASLQYYTRIFITRSLGIALEIDDRKTNDCFNVSWADEL